MSTQPLITIGIPTFNRSVLLLRALRSALSQTYTNIEVVVVDNASTDDTWQQLQAIQDQRLRVIRNPENLGLVVNHNLCLQHATGELFLLLSDDDMLGPEAIEKLSLPFRESTHAIPPEKVGASWCPCINVDIQGRELWKVQGGPPIESSVDLIVGLFDGTRGPQFSGVLIRTADARHAGGYRGDRYGMMLDSGNWATALLHYSYAACIPENLMHYTIHSGSSVGTASIAEWRRHAENEIEDFAAVRRSLGDSVGERRILRARKHLLANITVTILMRSKGRPGWVSAFAKEFWRSRTFMLTPFVLKRILRDGWKLLRMK